MEESIQLQPRPADLAPVFWKYQGKIICFKARQPGPPSVDGRTMKAPRSLGYLTMWTGFLGAYTEQRSLRLETTWVSLWSWSRVEGQWMTVLDDSRHAGRRGILESCCYLWGLECKYFDTIVWGGGRSLRTCKGGRMRGPAGRTGSGV